MGGYVLTMLCMVCSAHAEYSDITVLDYGSDTSVDDVHGEESDFGLRSFIESDSGASELLVPPDLYEYEDLQLCSNEAETSKCGDGDLSSLELLSADAQFLDPIAVESSVSPFNVDSLTSYSSSIDLGAMPPSTTPDIVLPPPSLYQIAAPLVPMSDENCQGFPAGEDLPDVESSLEIKDETNAARLVKLMGDDEFETREAASSRLKLLLLDAFRRAGSADRFFESVTTQQVLSAIRQNYRAKNSDLEIRFRAVKLMTTGDIGAALDTVVTNAIHTSDAMRVRAHAFGNTLIQRPGFAARAKVLVQSFPLTDANGAMERTALKYDTVDSALLTRFNFTYHSEPSPFADAPTDPSRNYAMLKHATDPAKYAFEAWTKGDAWILRVHLWEPICVRPTQLLEDTPNLDTLLVLFDKLSPSAFFDARKGFASFTVLALSLQPPADEGYYYLQKQDEFYTHYYLKFAGAYFKSWDVSQHSPSDRTGWAIASRLLNLGNISR